MSSDIGCDEAIQSDVPLSEQAQICPTCKGAGYYTLDVPIDHPDFGVLIPCQCKRLEWEKKASAQQKSVLDQLATEFGSLAQCTLDNFDVLRPLSTPLEWSGRVWSIENQRTALENAFVAMHEYIEEPGSWCFLTGPCGSGKSHLAAAVATVLARQGWHVGYASVPSMLDFVRNGFQNQSSQQRIEALQDVDFLVLDDIGTEHLTSWAEETLFRIINHRYLFQSATFFTSNLFVQDMPERLASRIAGQAFRHNGQIFLPVGDYRLLNISHDPHL